MTVDLVGDWALAVLTLGTVVAVFVRMQFLPKQFFCRRWAYRLMATGWTVLTARLWMALLSGSNPSVHPVSQIALSLVCISTIWVTLDVLAKHHNVPCKWGSE